MGDSKNFYISEGLGWRATTKGGEGLLKKLTASEGGG